jgi:hypothetical protein
MLFHFSNHVFSRGVPKGRLKERYTKVFGWEGAPLEAYNYAYIGLDSWFGVENEYMIFTPSSLVHGSLEGFGFLRGGGS